MTTETPVHAVEEGAVVGRPDERAPFEVLPVPIGVYERGELADLPVDVEVGRILELLASFDPTHHRWPGRVDRRDAAAVQRRLLAWAEPETPGNSLLYWVGHGWSDDDSAALAHATSPPEVRTFGVSPHQVADALRSRQLTADGAWAIVVIDACRSARFVELVAADLYRATGEPVERALLIGVSADGATALGRFSRALACTLGGTYKDRDRITLAELGKDLRAQLSGSRVVFFETGDAALVRSAPPPASLSGPLDSIRYLEDALAGLASDERRHFLVKAQSAEEGELSWFFEGRTDDCAAIAAWLAGNRSGLLIVTGLAGTGKSALLGHVLLHSLPEVRDALLRRGLIGPLAAQIVPPDRVFDHVLHLAGLTISETVARIALGAGLGPVPSATDASLGTAHDCDWLLDGLRRRSEPYTLLVDALDESLEPLDTARTVFARLAAQPGVRVVLGTRASTHETPDHPTPDDNLVRALAASPGAAATVHRLEQDAGAVRRYVVRRLTEARDHPDRRWTPLNAHPPRDEWIEVGADAIADRRERFLFARLAVHELLHDPTLLEPGRRQTLRRLLSGTHRDLFASAVDRLVRHHDAFGPLILALSLAKGRGLPVEDDVWGTAAGGLAPEVFDGAASNPVPRSVIQELIDQAPAYVTVDSDDGQTVYRLAHRTFVEHFAPPSVPDLQHRKRAQSVASALVRLAARQAPVIASHYLRRYLSGHVADAGMWPDLAQLTALLDGLDPAAVAADVVATLFGRRTIPAQLAAMVAARPRLVQAHPDDRAGLRHLSVLTHSGRDHRAEPTATWGVAGAALRPEPVHLVIPGHDGSANAVCPLTGAEGRQLLASIGDDRTVRLWDPYTAAPIGDPMHGHTGAVEDLCVFDGDLGTMIATVSDDATIRRWDPATGRSVGQPLAGHDGTIWEICAVRLSQGTLLVTAGVDGTVRFWDPVVGEQVVSPGQGHDGPVNSVCAIELEGRPCVVSGSDNGTLRFWDPLTGAQIADATSVGPNSIWEARAVRGRTGRLLIAVTTIDGVVRLWDPLLDQAATPPLLGHVGPVWRACALPGRDGDLLATAGGDGTIRLWDPTDGLPVGEALRGHTGTVWGVCGLPRARPGVVLLGSAGADGTIRIWEMGAEKSYAAPATVGPTPITRVAPVARPDGSALLAATRTDGTIRLWDPLTAERVGPPLTGHVGPVWSVCSVPTADGDSWIATAGGDGTIRLWDPLTAEPVGSPLTGHVGSAFGVCVLSTSAGPVLASSGADGRIMVWDPRSGRQLANIASGHTGVVLAVCAVPRPTGGSWVATAGEDGTARVWDVDSGIQVGLEVGTNTGSLWGVCAVQRPGGGSRLATAGDDGTVRLWDLETGSPAGPPLAGHIGTAWSVGRIPDGSPGGLGGHLVSTGQDGTICLWDPAVARLRGAPMDDSDEHVAAIREVRAASAPSNWAIVTRDGQVSTWTLGSTHWRPLWRAGLATSLSVVDGPAAPTLVIGTADGVLHFCDSTTGAATHDPVPAGSPVLALALAPAAGAAAVVVGGGSGAVGLWSVERRQWLQRPVPVLTTPVRSLCWLDSPAGAVVACGGDDGTIALLDVATWTGRGTLHLDERAWVWALCRLPVPGAAARLVSAGSDHRVTVWDPLLAEPVGEPLLGHTDQVRAVTAVARSDGRALLATGGQDGVLCLWHPDTTRLVHRIPLGVSICDLAVGSGDDDTARRTDGGALIAVGTRTGTIAVDVNAGLFG